MGVRTVRMEAEDEKRLARILRRTGWTASDVLKRGVQLLDETLAKTPTNKAFEVYSGLDLGPGGYASGPASESREAARRAILRKHKA